MANYSLGKISKQPFPPTIFYDTLKAIIAKLSFNFNFNLVESWDSFILDFSNHSTHPPEKV